MIRTDLALEAKEFYHENAGNTSEIDGVVSEVEKLSDDITVTTVKVLNENGKKALNKEIGTYITVEMPNFSKCAPCFMEDTSEILKNEILKLFTPKKDSKILVAGLGNRHITPDSLGPLVSDKIIVTRHLFQLAPSSCENLGYVSCITPGVMGSTGLETSESILAICKALKPDAVFVIDSLAARSCDRVGCTVQLSDTGLSPGSGIGNVRNAINKETLGIPVIAIGIPMVIFASTLAFDTASFALRAVVSESEFEKITRKMALNEDKMLVSPSDSDSLIKHLSDLLSSALNLVFHNIKFNEISYYLN